MNLRTALLLAFAASLAACHRPSDSAFYNRGGPESLLDVSSEVVNLSVAQPNELDELSRWIEQDQPTRAELYCNGDMMCARVQQVLDLHGVPTMEVPSSQYSVTLVYERILARDCDPRFIDNSSNVWNKVTPSFGCTVAANVVQHVSDKQQFVSPNVSDPTTARTAVQAYDRAYIPYTTRPIYNVEQSLAASAGSN